MKRKQFVAVLLMLLMLISLLPFSALTESDALAAAPETVPETIPEAVPEGSTETAPEAIPETVPEEIPEPDPEPEEYTVCFDLRGHGAELDPVTVPADGLLEKPEDPEEEGYVFVGWTAEEEGESLWDFELDSVTENITLFAVWTEAEEEAPTEPSFPPFSQSMTVSGVTVTVSAPEGVFPEGATLSVKAVPREQVEAALEDERGDSANVAVSYTFDIKILDAEGAVLQPPEGTSVSLSFSLAEVMDETLETHVYHVSEGEDGDLKAKALETQETDDSVITQTGSFSYFTVEFTEIAQDAVRGTNVTAKTWSELVAFMNNSSLSGGVISLGDDIDLTDGTLVLCDEAGFSVTLDLNGFTITREGDLPGGTSFITVGPNTTLTIMDSSDGKTGLISLDPSGGGTIPVITVSGGTLILNSGTVFGADGGVSVVQEGSPGSFTMNGGAIEINQSSAVRVSGGTFTLNSGNINMLGVSENNSVVSVEGARSSVVMTGGVIDGLFSMYTVYLSDSSTFTMSGGTIRRGRIGMMINPQTTFTMSGGTISNCRTYGVYVFSSGDRFGIFRLSGSPVFSQNNSADVFLQSDKTVITLVGALSVTDPISVELNLGTGIITSGYGSFTCADPSTYCCSISPDYQVALSGSEAVVTELPVYTVSFLNDDGSSLQSCKTLFRTVPVYLGKTPEKSDSQNTWIWTGWKSGEQSYSTTESLPPVSGDAVYTATFEAAPVEYTVTVNNEDGHGTGSASPASCAAGVRVQLTPEPQPDYRLAEWQVVSGGPLTIEEDNSFIMPAANVVILAVFEPLSCRVTFLANGGTGAMPPQDIPYGTKTPLNANQFQSDVFVFDSWNTKEDGSGDRYTDGQEVTLTEGLTLYAQWKVPYVDAAGGDMPPQTCARLVSSDDPVTLSDGWYAVTETVSFATAVSIEGNVNLILCDGATLQTGDVIQVDDGSSLTIWQQKGGSGAIVGGMRGIMVFSGTVVQNGGAVSAVSSAGPQDGAALIGGSYTLNNGSLSGPHYGVYLNDGYFTQNGGTVSGSTGVYVEGGIYSLSGAPAVTGSSGAGVWLSSGRKINVAGALGNTSPIVVDPADGLGIFTDGYSSSNSDDPSAHFSGAGSAVVRSADGKEAQLGYSVTVTVSPDGSGKASASPQFGDTDTKVTLSATPETDWRFQQWEVVSGGVTVSDENTFTFGTANVEIKAVFESAICKVTFLANGGEGEMQPQEILYGTETPLNANQFQSAGRVFDSWNTAADGGGDHYTDGQKVTLTGDLTLYAQWTKLYTVQFNSMGGSNVESQEVEDGKTVTKPENPVKAGYSFAGWYEDQTLRVPFDFSTPITRDGIVLYAKWNSLYYYTSGANSIVSKGSTSALTLVVKRSEADVTCFGHFTDVLLDGSALKNGSDYDAAAGSTVITLRPTLLQRLSIGVHSVTIVFDDGRVTTGLTITTSSPKTGDSSHPALWAGVMLLSVTCLGGLLVGIRRRRGRR